MPAEWHRDDEMSKIDHVAAGAPCLFASCLMMRANYQRGSWISITQIDTQTHEITSETQRKTGNGWREMAVVTSAQAWRFRPRHTVIDHLSQSRGTVHRRTHRERETGECTPVYTRRHISQTYGIAFYAREMRKSRRPPRIGHASIRHTMSPRIASNYQQQHRQHRGIEDTNSAEFDIK